MSKNIINLFKSVALIMVLLFISSIIINTLYYFDVINNNLVKYFKMFLSIISFFIGGINIGKKTDNKGYISGLKLSLIIVIIITLLSIIIGNFSISRIIYLLILTTAITFGSMIGINKKTTLS